MTDSAVEVDQQLLILVVDVRIGRLPPRTTTSLTLTLWEPVGAFDGLQVAVLEHRTDAVVHVIEDAAQQGTVSQLGPLVERRPQPSGVVRPSWTASATVAIHASSRFLREATLKQRVLERLSRWRVPILHSDSTRASW